MASQTVSAGTVATLSVVATPNASSYQWRKAGANISGATASSLVFNPVQQTDEGTYSVIVRNGIGIVTSANAVLTVTAAANNPPVLGAIGNRTVDEGAALTFTAGANDPDVDRMVDAILAARSADDFRSAVRAHDRMLLSNHYVLPLYHLGRQWVARHRHIARPAIVPLYGYQFPVWWDANAQQ